MTKKLKGGIRWGIWRTVVGRDGQETAVYILLHFDF